MFYLCPRLHIMATIAIKKRICDFKRVEIKSESVITDIRKIFLCFRLIGNINSVSAKFLYLFIKRFRSFCIWYLSSCH